MHYVPGRLREAAKKFFFSGPATKKRGRAWPLIKRIFIKKNNIFVASLTKLDIV